MKAKKLNLQVEDEKITKGILSDIFGEIIDEEESFIFRKMYTEHSEYGCYSDNSNHERHSETYRERYNDYREHTEYKEKPKIPIRYRDYHKESWSK